MARCRCWDAASGQVRHTLAAHTGGARAVAFVGDSLLLTGGADGRIGLWQLPAAQQVATLRGHLGDVFVLRVAPDRQMLASGACDGTVRLWRLPDGAPLQVLRGHRGRVFDVAFAPDQQMLASTGEDGTVRLWRLADGQQVRQFTLGEWELHGCNLWAGWQNLRHCHADWNRFYGYAVAFSPDGRHLLYADGNVVQMVRR